ncbi:MAG TPA: TonB-dependent receptor [Cyclobacteriaceae bacterium]
MKFLVFVVCAVFSVHTLYGQADSTKVLGEVVVSAYRSDRPASEVPSSIGLVNEKDLLRFNNTSLLPAVNTVPGVRMEERSPGSYRFSIRGSLLRSPFGVRNVKFYWNGLPLTDGGGNTYLNLLDFNSIGGMEIIKGPGASLYGAGTGGVVLLKSPAAKNDQIQVSALFGSYGLRQFGAIAQTSGEKMDASIRFNSQRSNGYRQQSEMSRDAFNADLNFYLNSKNTISTTLFNSHLTYQTPGGLTKTQYDEDARQARPGTATTPGAVEQKAAVDNNTTYLGLSHEVQWNKNLSTRTGFYGSTSKFKNPTIRNYEDRDEKNGGLRTETQYILNKDSWKAKFTGGAELQFFKSTLGVFGNDKGTKTSQVLSMDDLNAKMYLFFVQAEVDLPQQFYLTLGASLNSLKYKDQQSITATNLLTKNFDSEISPRVALLKKINANFSLYGSISRGFSPPTFAEALPSTGGFNPNLDAEHGISYEIGMRGKFLKQFDFSIAAYDFEMKNAIVIQRAADGADYFVNAGSTVQKGLEGFLGWNHTMNDRFINSLRIWTSVTINHYRFKEYEQSGVDYSGNPLTGVAPDIIVGGLDITTKPGLYLNITTNYTDHIPLSDAADQYAADYVLLGSRIGLKRSIKKIHYEIFVGIDNALDQKYSLGNDLNAAGRRYYNVAADRNYYGGLKIALR